MLMCYSVHLRAMLQQQCFLTQQCHREPLQEIVMVHCGSVNCDIAAPSRLRAMHHPCCHAAQMHASMHQWFCHAGAESEGLSRQPSSLVDGFENFDDNGSDSGFPGKSPRRSETSEPAA